MSIPTPKFYSTSWVLSAALVAAATMYVVFKFQTPRRLVTGM